MRNVYNILYFITSRKDELNTGGIYLLSIFGVADISMAFSMSIPQWTTNYFHIFISYPIEQS